MSTTLTTALPVGRALSTPVTRRVSESVEQPASLVESGDLLRGQKTVGILHNGALYRLQATKLGKLILTK